MRLLSLAFLLAAAPQSKQEKAEINKRIEETFNRLATEKTEPLRAAARAELEAIGRPVLPVVKRFLEEELQRSKKAKERAEAIADRYVPRLDDEAVESREAAALALIEQGETILPGLKKYEKSSSAEIRARVKAVTEAIEARRTAGGGSRLSAEALQLFTRLSDPAGAALVAGFFESRDPDLRLQAVRSFHEVALPADLPKLKPLLADADLKVRALACAATADLGLDAAAPMLLEVVRAEKDPNVWMAALNAMARWRSLWTADVTARVSDMLPAAPPERRKSLLYAFFRGGRLHDPPETILKAFRALAPAEKMELLTGWPMAQDAVWLAVLRTLASDPDPAVADRAATVYGQTAFLRFGLHSLSEKWDSISPEDRLFAARALGGMTETHTSYAVRILLREKDPILRIALLKAGFDRPSFVEGNTLREALLSGQPDLMLAVADLYHHNTIVQALPAYRYVFQTTADAALRAHIGLSLAAAEGDARGIEHAAAFLKDSLPRLRARACDAVAATRAAEHADAVAPLLKDPDLAVRRAAGQALLACGDPKHLNALWELRTDSTLEYIAIRAVGKLGKAPDVDRLEKYLAEKPAAKSQAAWALFHLSPLEPHPLLRKLAQDKDAQVRTNAQRALDDVKIAAAIQGGPPPAFDSRFAYERDFVFVPAEQCTAKVAAEKRAIPISLKDFLGSVEPAKLASLHGILFSRAHPRACPPEVLDSLVPENPRLRAFVLLLRSHPYPEAGPKLAALQAAPNDAYGELFQVLLWCDPVLARKRVVDGIAQGTLPDGPSGITKLADITPADEHLQFLVRLAKHSDAAIQAAAERALAMQPPPLLCRMLADGRYTDRAAVLRTLARQIWTDGLPVVEESLKDKDPLIRTLAAVALLNLKGESAAPAALAAFKDAPPDAAWELAAKLIVLLKEEHRPLLPADSPSPAVHALLARLGRKESVPRVLEGFPPTSAGKLVAGLALAPHFDPAVEAKLLPFLDGDRDGALGPCAALAKSQDAATRRRVMAALQAIPLYASAGRIHPAIREALEALIAKAEPGALERAAMYRGYPQPGVREEAVALLRKEGTDPAAALLLEFLNVPISEIPVATPLVMESIKAHVKGPKTREKLRQMLAAGMFLDHGALLPLFAEMGVEAELEGVLEQRARGSSNTIPSLGAMQLLARSPERLRKLSQEMGASKEPRDRVYGAFAAYLAGSPVSPEEWRARYLQWGGSEATLLAGELRIVEAAGEMLRRQKRDLSGMYDAGMAAALPLLTCTGLRPPEHASADYWPAMAKFLGELNAWVKQNRGRKFEEVFADALKARGYAGGASDPKALLAALDDKDDFIAANAAWMLRRVSGRALTPALSFRGEWGRWAVRRPDGDEVVGWKKWLAEKK